MVGEGDSETAFVDVDGNLAVVDEPNSDDSLSDGLLDVNRECVLV